MSPNTADIIKHGQILSSLSSSALLGLLVLVLAYIVWHLYKHQQSIMIIKQDKLLRGIEDIKENLTEQNIISKAQLEASKEMQKNIIKFIETHCASTNEKLDSLKQDISELSNKITYNSRLEAILKDKD